MPIRGALQALRYLGLLVLGLQKYMGDTLHKLCRLDCCKRCSAILVSFRKLLFSP